MVEFVRALTRVDATALVAGSMVGSGIFIVSADIARQVGSPGMLQISPPQSLPGAQKPLHSGERQDERTMSV